MSDGVMSERLPYRLIAVVTLITICITSIPSDIAEAAEDESYEIEYDGSAGTFLITMKDVVKGHSWKASIYYDERRHIITESAIAMSSPEGNGIRITDTSGSLQNLDGHNYLIDLDPNEDFGERLHFEFTINNDQDIPLINIVIAAIIIVIVSAILIVLLKKLLVVKRI